MTKKRFFWDSKLASWIEDQIFRLERWYLEKRYPIDWDSELYAAASAPVAPPIVEDSYLPPQVEEVTIKAPKVKKPRKKKTKKSSLVI